MSILLFAAAPAGKSLCCGAKFAMTFMDAAPEVKLAVLLFAIVAAVAAWTWVRSLGSKAREAPRAAAFLAAWAPGAPLLAVGVAAYVLMNFFVALYSYPPVPPNQAYGPALAEAGMVLAAGFLAGAFATLARKHLASLKAR